MNRIIQGDALEELKKLPPESVDCCITSPPYYNLRDYGIAEQYGLEETPEEYVQKLVGVFREVRRVLKKDGTLWVNIGDGYAGSGKGRNASGEYNTKNAAKQHTNAGTCIGKLSKTSAPTCKPKDLIGIPWMLAFALRADGWYLRQDIIWEKPNPMPESVKDRCTKSHEYIFLLSKSPSYYFNAEAIAEPAITATRTGKTIQSTRYGGKKYTENPDEFFKTKGGGMYNQRPTRNKRDVWRISTKPFRGAHFATFPIDLIEPCVLAGSREGGVVLDPFAGSGTTGAAALKHGRDYCLIEISPEYTEIIKKRVGAGSDKGETI